MRQYLIGSWNNADSYDYSGEQLMGNRLGASREVPHFTASGKANVAKYGDNTAKEPKVSIADRILPQGKRLITLRSQMVELEQSYRAGEMSITDYSLYRDVIVAKIERQEVLVKKAASLRPIRDETDEVEEETAYSSCDVHYTYTPTPYNHWLDDFIAELPDRNCFKNFLKIACKVTRKAVRWHQKARNYINELKAV